MHESQLTQMPWYGFLLGDYDRPEVACYALREPARSAAHAEVHMTDHMTVHTTDQVTGHMSDCSNAGPGGRSPCSALHASSQCPARWAASEMSEAADKQVSHDDSAHD